MRTRFLWIAVLLIAAPTFRASAQNKDLPKEYQQILPRGGIPAVMNPVYVKAKDAEISPDTWVLGVVIDGQARAYSLNLLNHHEIVNDQIGSTPFAAVW